MSSSVQCRDITFRSLCIVVQQSISWAFHYLTGYFTCLILCYLTASFLPWWPHSALYSNISTAEIYTLHLLDQEASFFGLPPAGQWQLEANMIQSRNKQPAKHFSTYGIGTRRRSTQILCISSLSAWGCAILLPLKELKTDSSMSLHKAHS